MNAMIKVILVSAALSLPAFSGSAFGHSKTDSASDMMMDQQQMTKMHEQMHANQALMEQIKREDNADKRENMMQQHMQTMREHMQMMGGMMGTAKPAKPSAEAIPEQMQMMNMRMDMMNMRMDMMQSMMEQMMDHQEQDAGPDHHRDN